MYQYEIMNNWVDNITTWEHCMNQINIFGKRRIQLDPHLCVCPSHRHWYIQADKDAARVCIT